MLAVVVDDHDMEVTHVIRGDDHLTNAFRQTQLYRALGWEAPAFAHIPLIHGPDGAKMSKRHGALGVDAYREQGYLPEALCNYLIRLGWSHGDDEIISREQATEWFGLDAVGRGAARFDFDKLASLNGHYIRQSEDQRLIDLIMPLLTKAVEGKIAETTAERLKKGMPGLKERAKTLLELSESAEIYACRRPLPVDDKASKLLDAEGLGHLGPLRGLFSDLGQWSHGDIEAAARAYAETAGIKLGKAAQPLRAAITGRAVSPGIFEVMEVLGREETLGRLDDALNGHK
jgi:glutamyl-tRNA synthetase